MPIWEKRNQLPFQEKLQREMARVGLDAMLLILPENIYYSTGYASNFAYITGEVGRTVAVVPVRASAALSAASLKSSRRRAAATSRSMPIPCGCILKITAAAARKWTSCPT